MMLATTDWWSVGADIAVAAGTILLGIMALAGIFASRKIALEQQRPYIAVGIKPKTLSSRALDLNNVSQTAAMEIAIKVLSTDQKIMLDERIEYIAPTSFKQLDLEAGPIASVELVYKSDWGTTYKQKIPHPF